ncbi:MAG: ImmA/IrrE family metallo-endopeptidase [Flavobacterium sp.]|nr:MAG: ImmA/IrrE family metallo-endopeptidase [Flavobacterium sp.]
MANLVLEKDAARFRSERGINNNEPIRLKSLLQKSNVIAVFEPLAANFSGMAIKAGQQSIVHRFMLINSSQSLGKQHFTICHELYHLYLQPDFVSQLCVTGRFDKGADKQEYYADIFASYLLLPNEGLLENIPNEELRTKKISLKTILFIEQLYSCSRAALLYRLKTLGLISTHQYAEYGINVKRGALENGYSISLYEPGNNNLVIGDYGGTARELYDKEKISQSHYYSLLKDLGVDVGKLNQMVDGDL